MNYTISFNELNSIISKIQGGDIVLIKDGIYTNQNVNISSIAFVKNRLYIKAENSGKVIFSENLNFIISGSYITVSGFHFENGGNTNSIQLMGVGNRITNCKISFNNENGPIISVYNKNNRIDHCLFENFDKEGVWIEIKRKNELNYALIDHNIFKNRAQGVGNGFETIRIGVSTNSLSNSRTIVMSNIFENCNGEIEIISSKSSENIIYNNIIKNSKGSITLRHGDRSIVSKNKFLQNSISGTFGVRIIGEDHLVYNNLFKEVSGPAISISNGVENSPLNGYAQVKRLKVSENILINNNNDFLIGTVKGDRTLPPIHSQIIGNIVYKNNNNSIFSYDSYGSLDMYYYNNYFYGYNIGKSPFEYDVILDPEKFNTGIIDEYNYGTNDIVGPLYNIEPENTEIKVELNHNYHKIKSKILTDFYVHGNNTLKTYENRNLLSNNTSELCGNFIFPSLFLLYFLFKNCRQIIVRTLHF